MEKLLEVKDLKVNFHSYGGEVQKVSDTHYAATWLLHPKAPKIDRPINI